MKQQQFSEPSSLSISLEYWLWPNISFWTPAVAGQECAIFKTLNREMCGITGKYLHWLKETIYLMTLGCVVHHKHIKVSDIGKQSLQTGLAVSHIWQSWEWLILPTNVWTLYSLNLNRTSLLPQELHNYRNIL